MSASFKICSYKRSTIYEELVKSCKSNYSLRSDCTVNKFLLGFRGRCSFKVYITNKKSKYAIKVDVLADNESSLNQI